jgi:hypothetical protein
VKCLAATACPNLVPSPCSGVTPTACDPCPLDDRPPQPCGTATASGGQGVTKTRHGFGDQAGTVRIAYQMYTVPDRLDCYYRGVLVATTGGLVSGSGELNWHYDPQDGDPSWCLVVMSAPNDGTAWTYTLHCPA